MKTKIGGQAVLEGVMMRGESSMALAVRDENGKIRMDATRLSAKRPWYRRVPFVRGVVNLVLSFVSGMKIISKSAEVYAEGELDPGNGKTMPAVMAISMLIGLALAVLLFVFLPTRLAGWIMQLFGAQNLRWLRSLLEGLFKILVFVLYLTAITAMKDIRRVFMYHGAEHKTISCYEKELPLTVENVKKCSRYHDRCGTSFIVFVVVLSILLMFAVEAICYAVGFEAIERVYVRVLVKIAMLPLTAAVSYEMLMLLARTDFVLFRPLKWLGKQFQKLTTREPDEDMCRVAIAAFNKVLEMDADPNVPEEHFPDPLPLAEVRKQLQPLTSGQADEADVDWILCAVLGVKRNQLKNDLPVPFGFQIRIEKLVRRCREGEPLQYVLGNADFYGRLFTVTPDVLIPRPETELVCEQAVKRTKKGQKVLDLCCGSGVIGITVALETGADVTLADLSQKALQVARKNAKQLKAKVKFAESDMFDKIQGTFDLIVCNPPYVATDVIDTLDDKVKNFEPRTALDGGADGLKFYRILAEQAPSFLKKDGVLVLEIGYDQKDAVSRLLADGFIVETQKDYDGNDRIVLAVKKENHAE